MKTDEFLNSLRVNGRYSFTALDAMKALALGKIPVLNTLRRLRLNKQIVSPAKGFYLILPPEYQAFGCLPANMFAPDLMKHLELPYYVGFLSAAEFYGAAHQKPQQFQVVIPDNRRFIQCGRIYIRFIANKYVSEMPMKKFNTPAGMICVATPEVLAADLVSAPQHGAGINNVATVLLELAKSLDIKELTVLFLIRDELVWVQRLGYLLQFLKFNKLADRLYTLIEDKPLHWVKLVANAPYKNLSRHTRWKIIINTKVEPDE